MANGKARNRRLPAPALRRPVNPGEQTGSGVGRALADTDSDAKRGNIERAQSLRLFVAQREMEDDPFGFEQETGVIIAHRIPKGLNERTAELGGAAVHAPDSRPAPGEWSFSHRRWAARRPGYRQR